MKSLGILKYPKVTVESFSGGRGEVVLKLEGNGRYVKVQIGIHCVKQLIDTAHGIMKRYQQYVQWETNMYENLKEYTNYKEK